MQNESIKKAAVFAIVLLCIMVAFAPAISSSFSVKTIDHDTQVAPVGTSMDPGGVAVVLDPNYYLDGDTVTYDVYFGITSPPPKAVSNQTNTTYDPPGSLDYNTTYYWQIVAWDGYGNSTEGPIWHFTTEEQEINIPPVAVISAPSTDNKKTPITFDGSGSYDPDGMIVNYTWNFDDGNIDTGMIVVHSYTNSGTYTVALQITDDDSATDVATHEITINNNAPTASFVADYYNIEPGETVTFDGSGSSDPDGDSLSYEWVLGEDTVIGDEAVIAYTFTEPGNFPITLTVTDDDAINPLCDSVVDMIYVNAPPIADAGPDQTVSIFDMPVTLDGSGSYDPDGTIVSYFWDFGDETTGEGVIVEHSYSSNMEYTVTLTVTDNNGAADSDTCIIDVVIALSAGRDNDEDNDIECESIETTDSNCVPVTKAVPLVGASSEIYISYVPRDPFPEDDATNVSVDVVLNWTGDLNHPPNPPTIDGPTRGKRGVEYEYTFVSTDPDGDDVSYFIDWGDDTYSGWIGPNVSGEQIEVSHVWSEKGTYTIRAKARDLYGAESGWGTLSIRMPRNRLLISSLFLQFLERLIERFPHMFPILRNLLEL